MNGNSALSAHLLLESIGVGIASAIGIGIDVRATEMIFGPEQEVLDVCGSDDIESDFDSNPDADPDFK